MAHQVIGNSSTLFALKLAMGRKRFLAWQVILAPNLEQPLGEDYP